LNDILYHNFAICVGYRVNFYTKRHKFRLLGAPGSVKIGSGADLVGIGPALIGPALSAQVP
jgi:hypothetical protein